MTVLSVPSLVRTAVELLCSDHMEMVNQCWSKTSERQKKKREAGVYYVAGPAGKAVMIQDLLKGGAG